MSTNIPKFKTFFLFVSSLLFVSCVCHAASTKTSASAFSGKPAQQQVFTYLKEKTGTVATIPAYPQQSVIAWTVQRHREEKANAEARYTLVAEDLLIARKLLNSKDIRRQRQGLRLTHYTSVFVFNKLGDKWLYARIFEGFLLPHLSVAHVEQWQDLSQQRLAEGGASAFEQAGEKENQVKALRLLLRLQPEQNTQDWARGELAQVLASLNRYAEAISELKAIKSPNMNNIKKLIPRYEQRLRELQSQRQKSTKQAEPKKG